MGRGANAGSDSRLDSARWGHQGHTAGAGERDLFEGAMGVRILGCTYKAEAIPYSRRFRCRCFDDEPSQTIWLCEANGLRALESKLSAEMLAQCAKLETHDVDLSLPKFKFEPPTIVLAKTLQA